MGRQTEATDQTAADYVEHALEDLNQARQGAQAEMRAAIESAAERTREVLHDLKGDVTGRAEELRTRHKEQTWEWQRELEEASDQVRLTEQLREFLDAHRVGVLATVAEDGKPRQSVVYYVRDEDRLLISTLSKRLKARDVGQTAWASLSVRGDEQPYPSATFSGRAEILTEDIGRQTARIMHRIAGTEEPPEPQSDEALAALDRVILAITVERVSAVTHM